MSFAACANSLYIQHGLAISPKKVWTLVQTESKNMIDSLEDEAFNLFEHGVAPDEIDLAHKKPLIIGIDGGFVRKWKKKGSFEAKCATLFTGTLAQSGTRRSLRDRIGYSADVPLSEFAKRVSVLALKCGQRTASSVWIVSDGAHWISNMARDWFPGAIHLLDMYHLKHRLSLLFGHDPQGYDGEVYAQVLAAVEHYQPEVILKILDRWTAPNDKKDEGRR